MEINMGWTTSGKIEIPDKRIPSFQEDRFQYSIELKGRLIKGAVLPISGSERVRIGSLAPEFLTSAVLT